MTGRRFVIVTIAVSILALAIFVFIRTPRQNSDDGKRIGSDRSGSTPAPPSTGEAPAVITAERFVDAPAPAAPPSPSPPEDLRQIQGSIRESTGVPVAAAVITLRFDDRTESKATSSELGRFEFRTNKDAAAATVTLGHSQFTLPDSELPPAPPPDGGPVIWDIIIRELREISGMVVKVDDGTPLAGAKVQGLWSRGAKDAPAGGFTTKTDASGRFRVRTAFFGELVVTPAPFALETLMNDPSAGGPPPAEPQEASFDASRFLWPESPAVRVNVREDAERTFDVGILGMSRSCVLRVLAMQVPDNRPVAGIRIRVPVNELRESILSPATDASGFTRFRIPPGTRVAHIVHPSLKRVDGSGSPVDKSLVVQGEPDNESTQVIYLGTGALSRRQITVSDEMQAPVAGAVIRWREQQVTTGPNGFALLEAPSEAGADVLRVEAEGFQPLEVPAFSRSFGAYVNLTLRALRSVEVELVTRDGAIVKSAELVAVHEVRGPTGPPRLEKQGERARRSAKGNGFVIECAPTLRHVHFLCGTKGFASAPVASLSSDRVNRLMLQEVELATIAIDPPDPDAVAYSSLPGMPIYVNHVERSAPQHAAIDRAEIGPGARFRLQAPVHDGVIHVATRSGRGAIVRYAHIREVQTIRTAPYRVNLDVSVLESCELSITADSPALKYSRMDPLDPSEGGVTVFVPFPGEYRFSVLKEKRTWLESRTVSVGDGHH